MKMILNDPKTGLSYQQEVPKEKNAFLLTKHIGEKLTGDLLGLPGYELLLTGGTDSNGFPMKKGITAFLSSRVLSKGTGVRGLKKGQSIKKTVSLGAVHEKTAQINLKIEKIGSKSLDELGFKQTPKEQKEEKKAKK
ncbi:30S ribosomal protein S6e [uncultured archaeon]|nr:30S ribosomal protein S6e [uncultured archaeon]